MKTLIFALLLALYLSLDANAQTTQTATFALTWTANNTLQTGFNVERALGQKGTFSKIGQTNATTTNYNDVVANDPGNTTYCYRVAAFNTSGQGPYSNTACATSPTIVIPPGNPPLNVTVTVTVNATNAVTAAPTKAKK